MAPHVRPLSRENTVHHDVARAAVAADAEVPDHAVLLRAERFDGPLRPEVEVVRPQAHHLATQRVERVTQEHQLARGVDVRALATAPVPRMPISNRSIAGAKSV